MPWAALSLGTLLRYCFRRLFITFIIIFSIHQFLQLDKFYRVNLRQRGARLLTYNDQIKLDLCKKKLLGRLKFFYYNKLIDGNGRVLRCWAPLSFTFIHIDFID